LVKLPPAAETLRGSLIERYLTCGNPNCKCARGQRHGPGWYLSVTLGPGRTTGTIVPVQLLERVRRWIENCHKLKEHLESASCIVPPVRRFLPSAPLTNLSTGCRRLLISCFVLARPTGGRAPVCLPFVSQPLAARFPAFSFRLLLSSHRQSALANLPHDLVQLHAPVFPIIQRSVGRSCEVPGPRTGAGRGRR